MYQTTAKPLPKTIATRFRQSLNIFVDAENNPIGHWFTPTQLLIMWLIVARVGRRIILILPTQYGKSLAVALAVLYRVATHKEKWAIIAPTEDKARIIMDYIIEHIFDDKLFYQQLEYDGTKEQLRQEKSKQRITFRQGGEVRIFTANANNQKQVKKALMGFGSPNIILDESALISDDLYSTVKRMLGGTKDNFLLEIGNPFFRNHFHRAWLNTKRYIRIFVDYLQALEEGRYTEEFIEEMREEAFFDILYGCHFPDQEDVPDGFFPLLSSASVENAIIHNELPIGHDEAGNLLDKPLLGIDPNHGGSNKMVAVIRYPLTGFAKVVLKKGYQEYKGKDITGEQLADAERLIREYGIEDYRCSVDAGNGGALSDALTGRGYLINSVMFGEAPEDKSRYANAKAELYWRVRMWVRKEFGKLLQDNGFLELMLINYKENASGKLLMESKADMLLRGIESPDTMDALALTFVTTSNIVDDDDEDII